MSSSTSTQSPPTEGSALVDTTSTRKRASGRQERAESSSSAHAGKVTIKTVRSKLVKMVPSPELSVRAQYRVDMVFHEDCLPVAQLRTIEALTTYCPSPSESAAFRADYVETAHMFVCDCPGCGKRCSLSYTLLLTRKFCSSADCVYALTGAAKRLNRFSLARQCLDRSQLLLDMTDATSVHHSFKRECLLCQQQKTTVVKAYLSGRGCDNLLCPAFHLALNTDGAVETRRTMEGLKSVAWDKWASRFSFRLVTCPRTETSPFRMYCPNGHISDQKSMWKLKQWCLGLSNKHPCDVCLQNRRWLDLVVKPLHAVGIQQHQIIDEPVHLPSNVNHKKFSVRCTGTEAHVTTNLVEAFVARFRGGGDVWSCPACNAEARAVAAEDRLMTALQSQGAQLLSYHRSSREVIYRCECGQETSTQDSNILRGQGGRCHACAFDDPDAVYRMAHGNSGQRDCSFTLIDGQRVYVQGWEGHGLDFLLRSGHSLDSIEYGEGMKEFFVKYTGPDGKTARHLPDAYLKQHNCVVEFKGELFWTAKQQRILDNMRAVLTLPRKPSALLVVVGKVDGAPEPRVIRTVSLSQTGQLAETVVAPYTLTPQPLNAEPLPDDDPIEMDLSFTADVAPVSQSDQGDSTSLVDDAALQQTASQSQETRVDSNNAAFADTPTIRSIGGEEWALCFEHRVWVTRAGKACVEGPANQYRPVSVTTHDGKPTARYRPHDSDVRVPRSLSMMMAVAWRVSGWQHILDRNPKWCSRFTVDGSTRLEDLVVVQVKSRNDAARAKGSQVRQEAELSEEAAAMLAVYKTSAGVARTQLNQMRQDAVARLGKELGLRSTVARSKVSAIPAIEQELARRASSTVV